MQKQFIFLMLIIAGIIFFACNNNPQLAKTASPTVKDNQITFKVNGDPVNTSGWNICRFNMGERVGLNITTNMHEDTRTLLINLRGDRPGEYSLNEGASGFFSGYGNYKPDYNDMLFSYRFVKGTVNISEIDTAKCFVNMSFSGTVARGADTLTISEGKILNGSLKRGIQAY